MPVDVSIATSLDSVVFAFAFIPPRADSVACGISASPPPSPYSKPSPSKYVVFIVLKEIPTFSCKISNNVYNFCGRRTTFLTKITTHLRLSRNFSAHNYIAKTLFINSFRRFDCTNNRNIQPTLLYHFIAAVRTYQSCQSPCLITSSGISLPWQAFIAAGTNIRIIVGKPCLITSKQGSSLPWTSVHCRQVRTCQSLSESHCLITSKRNILALDKRSLQAVRTCQSSSKPIA